MPARPAPSLKARALQWLAQREHSRGELRAKLLRHLKAQHARQRREALAAGAEAGAEAEAEAEPEAEAEAENEAASAAEAAVGKADRPDTSQVEPLLDWLEQRRYLSDARFIESRVQARAGRFGNRRIRQELAQHGLRLEAGADAALAESELARARAVWQRRFATPPADAAEKARQMRFLAGRGFSAEVIRRAVQGDEED